MSFCSTASPMSLAVFFAFSLAKRFFRQESTVNGLRNIFAAPSKVPQQNPAAVSALVDVAFKYHGKTFSKTPLISNVRIIDGEKYLLELRETETADSFVYKDSASMIVLISDFTGLIFWRVANLTNNTHIHPNSILSA